MDCLVCGCAACYYQDCCDHKNPVPPYPSEDELYMDIWYDEEDRQKIPKKRKDKDREM